MAFLPLQADGIRPEDPPIKRKVEDYRGGNFFQNWWDRLRGREPGPDYRPVEGENEE